MLITIIVVIVLAMPFTHYKTYKHGRITMNVEAVKKQGRLSFVLNGRVATLEREIARNFLACSTSCHGMPM